jgi:hypothetical protein
MIDTSKLASTRTEQSAQSTLDPVARLVMTALVIVMVFRSLARLVHRGRRLSRRASGWLEGAQHQEETQLIEAELTSLVRFLARIGPPSRWSALLGRQTRNEG